MITIYFLTKPTIFDPFHKVGFMTEDGKRIIAALWEQNGKHYVSTGSKVAGDLQHHFFTESQEAELESFLDSTAHNKEYWGHPVR